MVMVISASFVVIFCGVMCLTDTELMWRLYEWDCRQMNINPLRLDNWQVRVQQVGYGLIGLGVLGVMAGLGIV